MASSAAVTLLFGLPTSWRVSHCGQELVVASIFAPQERQNTCWLTTVFCFGDAYGFTGPLFSAGVSADGGAACFAGAITGDGPGATGAAADERSGSVVHSTPALVSAAWYFFTASAGISFFSIVRFPENSLSTVARSALKRRCKLPLAVSMSTPSAIFPSKIML